MRKSRKAISIFTFNRLAELKKCIASLKNCYEINDFDIILFSDGPRNAQEKQQVLAVRSCLAQIDDLPIKAAHFSDKNKGLAQSIITGLSLVFEDYEQVVVLEDDLIVSPNFLSFMAQALDYYQYDSNVFSIAGYTPKLKALKDYPKDVYFCPRLSSWGWAIWKDRWQCIDWEVSSYDKFKKDWKAKWQFTQGGIDLPRMLRHQMSGKINSWAIRAAYHQFLHQQVTVYPKVSKIKSIGFGEEATHTKKGRRFATHLDPGEERDFSFEEYRQLNPQIMKDFRKVFSMWNRLKDKF